MSKETDRLYELARKRIEERRKGVARTPPSKPPSKKQRQPSIFKKGANFIKSAAKHVAGGMKAVSQEEMDRRMAICEGCEFFTGGDRPKCSKCGCHLKIKARWESAHCPINKW